uniref:alpha/beta hydrolase n=1 Tax=Pseudomonas aeruginosa TaxID=287 RepID=UPI0021C8A470
VNVRQILVASCDLPLADTRPLIAGACWRTDSLGTALEMVEAGLPPLLVQVGEDELLRDDSLRLAQRAGEQGVAVRLQRYAGCWHVFQAHAGVLASADRALDEAAAFVVECSAEGDRCRTS